MGCNEGKEKGAGGPAEAGGNPRKTRRATGPVAAQFSDAFARLHYAFRDCAELHANGEMSTAACFGFLADVCQIEYDRAHGK